MNYRAVLVPAFAFVYGLLFSTQPFAQPNDPEYGRQLHLESLNDVDVDAEAAWQIAAGRGAQEIVVAVIDSALDTLNPDLVNRLWVNPGEVPDNGVDDDGNGYVDDYHGYDFINADGSTYDGIMNHATPVAGLIAAETDNGKLVSGVAGKLPVKIMTLQVVNIGDVLFPSRMLQNSRAIARATLDAMAYAVDHGARILNMSLNLAKSPEVIMLDSGVTAESLAERYFYAATNYLTAKQTYNQLSFGERRKIPPPRQPEREMLFYDLYATEELNTREHIEQMAAFIRQTYRDFYEIEQEYRLLAKKIQEQDVLIVTAGVNFPAEDFRGLPYATDSIDNIIKIGSVGGDGRPSEFSEYGRSVPVYAPGENLISTRPGLVIPWLAVNNGTSFSTAIVSGIAAMAWSLSSESDYRRIRDALVQGTAPLPALNIPLKDGSHFQAGLIKAPLVFKALGID